MWGFVENKWGKNNSPLALQVARKLVILEGELERAEERAEVSELWVAVQNGSART